MTASVTTLVVIAGSNVYTASKYGINEFVNQLASEFAAADVQFNGAAPRVVRTNIRQDLPATQALEGWINSVTPLARSAAQIESGSFGPVDIPEKPRCL